MDTVSSGSAAGKDNQICAFDLLKGLIFRHNSRCPAVYKRISQITLIKQDRAVNCGDTHLIAIIPHPAYHAFGNALGMQNALRKPVVGIIRRAKTKNIGIENWFCP